MPSALGERIEGPLHGVILETAGDQDDNRTAGFKMSPFEIWSKRFLAQKQLLVYTFDRPTRPQLGSLL